MSPSKHRRCPVPVCDRLARKGSLLCWEHWTHLPPALRQAVRLAERTHGVMSNEFRDARAAALNWWDREEASA